MKIIIDYESSWRNSFLDGNNNEPLPKKGRKFIGSMTNLKKPENYICRGISIDTVMGVLNRLIGDQRKLYQSRASKDYFFADIESFVHFNDKTSVINREVTYIRNISGSTDQNSYTGMIKTDDAMFTSAYSNEFWGVLGLCFEQLLEFVINDVDVKVDIALDPLTLIERLEELNKLKAVENESQVLEAFTLLKNRYPKFKGVNTKGLVTPISIYCSALYLQLDRLSEKYDMSTAKTKSGGISGISNNGFTKKDFMSRFTTGDKKKIWGNPYIHESFVKGEGKRQELMTKASGQLEINIDVDRRKGKQIAQMIENAGVSSFYLGKKGLAYVSKIRA